MGNDKKEIRKLQSLRIFTYFQEDAEESPDNVMAPYSICQDWYHKKCMNIPLKVFRSDTVAEV